MRKGFGILVICAALACAGGVGFIFLAPGYEAYIAGPEHEADLPPN